MQTGPIIVFDSGIGGLSIYRPLRRALPAQNIFYFADTTNFPYGNRTVAWLRRRFGQLAVQFAQLSPTALVVACNTATVSAIDIFRRYLSCPVVGVEPVIKPLAKYPHSLALMTKAAARSPQTQALLNKYGEHVQIYSPKGLAEAIEYNDYVQVKKILTVLKRFVNKHQVTAIGLSCTHYPLILPELTRLLPDIHFIDPSRAVVKQVMRVLRLPKHE